MSGQAAIHRRMTRQKNRRRSSPIEALESRTLLAGQLFVTNAGGATIGEYDTNGTPINASLLTGLAGGEYVYLAVSGTNLFVGNYGAGTVGEYSTSGATINASLLTGLNTTGVSPFGITISGSQLYLANGDGGGPGTAGTISEYTLGSTPGTIASSNPTFITGLADPDAVAVSGSDLFVTDYANGTVGEYTSAGVPVNTSLVSGLANPESIAITGNDLFVTSANAGTIGEYDTTGAAVNASLVTGLEGPCGISASGSDLFVANANGGTVGEYTTTGATVNAALVSGLSSTISVAVQDNVASTPNRLAFATQPLSAKTNGSLSPVIVDVEDSDGNLVNTDNSAVTLSLSSSTAGAAITATLGGTTTVAAVNGVATFSDLSITTAGGYVLTATDGTLTDVQSNSFNITAPAVVKRIGQVDPTFGTNGFSGHALGFSATQGLAQDGTQSVIIATNGTSPNESFGLTRYNADGCIDTTFGTGGIVTTSFGSTDDVPNSVVILPGGQILVGGTATTFTDGVAIGSEFALAEYNADGSLDTSFSVGTGQTLVSFSTTAGVLSTDILKSLVLNKAGVIYVGGSSNSAGLGQGFAVAALTSTGLPDTAFNATGKETLSFSGGDDVINMLALQANGSIVAAGSTTAANVTSVALARFLPTGILDKHFGTKGTVVTNVRGVYDSAASVAIEPKGQIVIGGLSATGTVGSLSSDFLLVRYTAAGKLDRSFAGGVVISSFGQPSSISKIVIEPTGQIIASGKTTASLTSFADNQLDVAIARYNTNGKLDTTFNGTGEVAFSLDPDAIGSETLFTSGTLTIASTLGDEFDQFVNSNQGRIAETPGGELLVSGTFGSDTCEAEIVASGVDLSIHILTGVPASVVGGAKGTTSMQIAENGTDLATGMVTIELELATDISGDGAVLIKMLPEHINLKQQQDSHPIKIAFVYPSAVSTGNYYLLANVLNGTSTSLQDLDETNNTTTSTGTVKVAPPYVSVTGTSVTAASTLIPGKAAHITLSLINDGNIPAKGSTTVTLILSPDSTTSDAIYSQTIKIGAGLAAGKPKAYRLNFSLPSSLTPGSYDLIALVDPLNSLGVNDASSLSVNAISSVTVS